MSTETLPQSPRPRIRRGVAVFAVDGGVMFAAGRLQKKIAGADAQRLLLPVATAMTGEHTIAELAEALSLPRDVVARVITILHRQGLVEPEPATSASPLSSASSIGEPVLDYFAMTAGGSGRFATTSQILAALNDSTVLTVAPPPLAAAINADLLATGVGALAAPPSQALAAPARSLPEELVRAGQGLVLLAHWPGRDMGVGEWVQACLDAGVAVLRFAVDGTAIEVGPLLAPHGPVCWSCFDASHQAHFPCPPAVSDDPAGWQVAAGMVVAQALAYLADLSIAAGEQALVRTAWPELTSQRFLVAPQPGCGACSTPIGRPAQWAEAYEDLVAAPSRTSSAAERPVSTGRNESYLALQRVRARYDTSPRVPCPDPGPTPGVLTGDWVRPTRSAAVDEAVLADLLLRVAGERPPEGNGERLRWTASGGNLGSVELFLLCREPLFGAAPGTVFKYDDLSHQLVTTMAPATDHPIEPAAALLILVGAVGRQRPKYGDFSLRLAHLDAGCALVQLHAAATGHGLRVTVRDRWASSLRESLELDEHEQITAVAQIWPGEG
ncbi:hypothetical protein Rhe02_38240 [Rhizocola hellebori]|uniref:Uncharacterized protein n=1 Tax=Rhizocola hellebori TaxID=1392758 RepID=A0A8J3VH12_9ACTN|nr:hypothetical protein [Rhizocola hellebori]GIH05757.1 hypothetical protein Rhe02_38240 [Rhizocola hellebori]